DSQYGYPDPEWDQTGYRGYDAGLNLKSTSGWLVGNGSNLYEFTGLPGGLRNSNGNFTYGGSWGWFWSSTEDNISKAWQRALLQTDDVYRDNSEKVFGFSVRCLRDY
ncbi:MAG: fibrobacter succinogenes major paralogous domain-containing protein, partial [Bacteroidales bacterium]|nr:fibrobacter succinogenes major paralogous domain-containing protein [Bacteroidales bacterium]